MEPSPSCPDNEVRCEGKLSATTIKEECENGTSACDVEEMSVMCDPLAVLPEQKYSEVYIKQERTDLMDESEELDCDKESSEIQNCKIKIESENESLELSSEVLKDSSLPSDLPGYNSTASLHHEQEDTLSCDTTHEREELDFKQLHKKQDNNVTETKMEGNNVVNMSASHQNLLNEGKRRKINMADRKTRRDAGLPYITRRKHLVPGKLPPSEERVCQCLHLKCGEVQFEDKNAIFSDFYKLDYNNQTLFLLHKCLKIGDIKRRTVSENISRRHNSVEYYVPGKNDKIRVCQKTLCSVLRVSPRRLQVLVKKVRLSKPLDDNRGKRHTSTNNVPN